MIRAIDVASYQPVDLTELIQATKAEHVVVRLYLEAERPSKDISRQQIASALANGCTVGGYLWAYNSLDPVRCVDEALALAEECGLSLKVLWIDAEWDNDQPNDSWLKKAVKRCLQKGVRPGLYSALSWLESFLAKSTRRYLANAGVVLWLADYNRIAELDCKIPVEWARDALWGKQYEVRTIVPVGEVDMDVFRREAARMD